MGPARPCRKQADALIPTRLTAREPAGGRRKVNQPSCDSAKTTACGFNVY